MSFYFYHLFRIRGVLLALKTSLNYLDSPRPAPIPPFRAPRTSIIVTRESRHSPNQIETYPYLSLAYTNELKRALPHHNHHTFRPSPIREPRTPGGLAHKSPEQISPTCVTEIPLLTVPHIQHRAIITHVNVQTIRLEVHGGHAVGLQHAMLLGEILLRESLYPQASAKCILRTHTHPKGRARLKEGEGVLQNAGEGVGETVA